MSLYAKLWTDILGDEKLMRAARKGAKQLALLPWLIAFAKKADDAGRLTVDGEPAEPEDIASGIPAVTAKQVATCMSELESIGVLTADDEHEHPGVLRFTSWERRSGYKAKLSPSDAPGAVRQRVTKHRRSHGNERNGNGHDPGNDARNDPCNEVGNDVGNEGVTTHVTMGVTSPCNDYARSRDVKQLDVKHLKHLKQQNSKTATAARNDAANDNGALLLAAQAGEAPRDPKIVLASAANRGIAERWGEQPTAVRWDHPSSFKAVEELEAAGVPIAFARDAIYSWCVSVGQTADGRPPATLRYFSNIVRERWDVARAIEHAGTSDARLIAPPDPFAAAIDAAVASAVARDRS